MNLFPTLGGILFNKSRLSEYIDAREVDAYRAVLEFDADETLNRSTQDVADSVLAHFRVNVPTLQREQEFMNEPAETSYEVNDYGRQIRVHGTQYELTIPFSGDSELFYLTPSASNSLRPTGTIFQRQLKVRVAGSELDGTETKRLIEKTISEVEQYLAWERVDADRFNSRLGSEIAKRIEVRKKTLLDSRNIAASLGYKMQPTLSYPTTHRAPQVIRKPTPASQAKTAKVFVSEPELLEDDYQHILKIIEAMCHVMERSPQSFSIFGRRRSSPTSSSAAQRSLPGARNR